MDNQEKYILVSLEKDKASETEISKELRLPLSTVHYNLQQLKKNSLVETKRFMYSEKGKKIEFYRVVKKFIVIAPKYTRRNLINQVLPLFLISAGIAFIIQWLSNLTSKVSTSNTLMAQDSLQRAT